MNDLYLLLSKFSLEVKNPYQIATECTFYLHFFYLFSLQFQSFVSNSVKMHQSSSLFSNFQGNVDLHYSLLIKTNHVLFVRIAVSNIVPNSVRMHA